MLEQKAMQDIPVDDWLEVLNHPALKRHMPLANERFDAGSCEAWLAAKAAFWETHGYGPVALVWDGRFVGWGGFQPEANDVDLSLVLLPEHWGLGPRIVKHLIAEGFQRFHFPSITIALPYSRKHFRALERLGFVRDGEVVFGATAFMRFRMFNS